LPGDRKNVRPAVDLYRLAARANRRHSRAQLRSSAAIYVTRWLTACQWSTIRTTPSDICDYVNASCHHAR
jgi:hypothetical protein